jgi:signal transduction histidine kinase
MTPTDKPKILIVDDQPRNLDVLEAMLGDTDCALVRATSAEEALLCLVRHEFAALVLDIKMPGMSGIELARLVKQRRRSQHVPILFLTAHSGDEADVLRGYGAGAVDYLSKPVNAVILRSKIGVFVDVFRKTRALADLNATLHREVAEREKAQQALQLANLELERRVQERTAALRDARDEAERQSRLKDEFLATLSHELRTPMNVILGWLDTLTKGKAIRDPRSALTVVQRNAEIQARLIDDLLDMNRLMAGNLQIELVSIDVGGTIRSAIQGLQPAADAKGVELDCVIEARGAGVLADARRLQQVMWNLLHNAIKFTPKGGRVEVRVGQQNGHVTIVVQDNGHGIQREFLPHVFERFRQQDASTTRESPGLGLGLAIAKHLVELHGGRFGAFSEGEGAGAKFVVELPAVT